MSFNRIFCVASCMLLATQSFSQKIGINTPNPAYDFDVNGTTRTTNAFVTGKIGIKTTNPLYDVHVVDGTLGFTSSVDNITWGVAYDNATNILAIAENGSPRMTYKVGGNIGINTLNPAYKLDINGTVRASQNVSLDQNALVKGYVTVFNGKGIISNAMGSGQLKYYTKSLPVSTNGSLIAFGTGNEISISFTAGTFTKTPKVFVGDITAATLSSGDLYKLQVVIYDVTTTGCKGRLINNGPMPVEGNVTFNLICIGE